jgi:branched-chain amino acid transport system substrate-binding protein
MKKWIVAGLLATVLAACTGARVPKESTLSAQDRDTTDTTTRSTDTTAVGTAPTAGGDPFAEGGATVPTLPGGRPAPTTAPTPARSTLFTAAEDRVGITKDTITICAHAALTYAAAFNTSADDLNVYWSAINDKGGIFGRKVVVTYENDNYSPDTAVEAATACKEKKPFLLLGGIGFDQIPAVRNWAETNRMLYVHHTATVEGTARQRFSFTSLPSTEKMGEMFAEVMATKFKGKTVGIIKRNSPNWEPGVKAFKELAKNYGIKIVAERDVQNSQGSYTQELLDMQRAGADVVWLWENALASTQIVRQAHAQGYDPRFLLFPFNLTSQTLNQGALDPPLIGVSMHTAYSNGDRSGPFAPYASDIAEFESQYAKYRPGANLRGFGGDLLFLNWSGQKGLAYLLTACGPDCSRNRLVDILTSTKVARPIPSSCDVDFTRPGFARMGGFQVNVMETYRSPRNDVNWRNTNSCVEHLL